MAILLVTSTADSGYGSLRQAISDADADDVILFDLTVFPSGTTTAILLSLNLALNKEITIDAGATESPRRVALDAQSSGRCVYLQSDAEVDVIGIEFRNASQTGNGGAVYCGSPHPCSFINCRFESSTGNTGGGLSTTVAADLTFDRCEFVGNSSSGNGGALYASSSASLTLSECTFSGNSSSAGVDRRGVYLAGTSSASFAKSTLDAIFVYTTASVAFSGGITTTDDATIQNNVVVSFDNGAAFTIKSSASIGSATFASSGRGYFATASGVDVSSATLSGVVLCSYGAGLETFGIDADGATWTADDLTVPILLERRESDASWTTLSSVATGGTYSDSFALGDTVRAFDGVRFFVASLDGYWRVDASFGSASGGGGAGDDEPRWNVVDATITPNLEEI